MGVTGSTKIPGEWSSGLRLPHTAPWVVFETLAADGSLAIGISPWPLPANAAMVVYDGLTERDAEQVATGYHRWRLRQTTT